MVLGDVRCGVDNVLEYLRRYVNSPVILSLEDIRKIDLGVLPGRWLDILSCAGERRIQGVLEYWGQYKGEFIEVVNYLSNNLVSVDLLHHGRSYYLLYGIKSSDGSRILYYEGGNPKDFNIKDSVRKFWGRLPPGFKSFYYEVHNGWYYLASGSMGPLPVESFFVLGDEEWGWIEDTECGVDLNNTLAVFSSGMGGYVCFELIGEEVRSLIWWDDKEPTLDVEFWSVVDTWTAMGFDP